MTQAVVQFIPDRDELYAQFAQALCVTFEQVSLDITYGLCHVARIPAR